MSRKVFAASSTLTERNGHEMKATKALKRHAHVEDLLSDVMERYSAIASDIQQQLLDAKTAVTRAKEAVKLQASSERISLQIWPVLGDSFLCASLHLPFDVAALDLP